MKTGFIISLVLSMFVFLLVLILKLTGAREVSWFWLALITISPIVIFLVGYGLLILIALLVSPWVPRG